MNLEFIDNNLNKKIQTNEEFIRYTFFEVRVKENLSEEMTKKFIELVEIKLKNLNYEVYKTGEVYTYNGIGKKVKENELLVAIKMEK